MKRQDFKAPYFKLYANLLLTKGLSRSLIADVHTEVTYFIPNDLYSILTTYSAWCIDDIYKHFGAENETILDEYFTMLFSKDLIFSCETPEELAWFPHMNLTWDYPSKITNAIINTNKQMVLPWEKIIHELDGVECPNVQIRFMDNYTLSEIEELVLSKIVQSKSTLVNIEIYMHHQKLYNQKDYYEFVNANKFVCLLVVNNAPEEKKIEVKKNNVATIYLTTKNTLNDKCCGVVSSFYFNANLSHFTESTKHNTCLNRKVTITANGEIKNCPSLPELYGNIKSTTIKSVVERDAFQKYWHLSKDKIKDCKVCEFRNICTDCRAYLQDPADILSKPLKCGYDPKTCTWSSWSTSKLNKNAIEHYQLSELIDTNA